MSATTTYPIRLSAGGDFHGGNHHVDATGQMVFFDFDSCAYGHRLYDLAVLRHNAALGQWDPGIAESVLAGYESQRPLSDEERAALPLFKIFRRIFRLATRAEESAYKGDQWVRDGLWADGVRALCKWSKEAGI